MRLLIAKKRRHLNKLSTAIYWVIFPIILLVWMFETHNLTFDSYYDLINYWKKLIVLLSTYLHIYKNKCYFTVLQYKIREEFCWQMTWVLVKLCSQFASVPIIKINGRYWLSAHLQYNLCGKKFVHNLLYKSINSIIYIFFFTTNSISIYCLVLLYWAQFFNFKLSISRFYLK